MGLVANYGMAFPQRLNSRGFFEFTGDVKELVRASIHQILGTTLGERVMLPTFGSRLREVLFEPIDDVALALARVYTIQAIEMWEPRVRLNDVGTSVSADVGLLNIYGAYEIINREITDSFQVALPRLVRGT